MIVNKWNKQSELLLEIPEHKILHRIELHLDIYHQVYFKAHQELSATIILPSSSWTVCHITRWCWLIIIKYNVYSIVKVLLVRNKLIYILVIRVLHFQVFLSPSLVACMKVIETLNIYLLCFIFLNYSIFYLLYKWIENKVKCLK